MRKAVESNNLEYVLYLLRKGKDINSKYSDYNMKDHTPLHIATRNKLNNLAYALILIGADINIKDGNGNVPLFHYSADSGDLNTFLRFRGNARVNAILLRVTAQVKDIKIFEAILRRGSVCIDTPDICGQTALYFTAYREPVSENRNSSKNETPFNDGVEVDIAKMLLDEGSKVNHQTHNGVTTLHAAIENGYFKLIDTLLEYDADVNTKTNINETPLHVSVRKNFEVISQILLNKGAKVNAKLTYYQITPLHIAVYKRNEKIVELLLRFGAELNCRTIFDLTPLHIATIVDSIKVVQLLLKFGVDVDAQDEFGRTALHIACKNHYGSIIQVLLNHGADINIINSDNCTPFDYAAVECSSPLKNTNTILKHHVIKLRALNLFVSEKNSEFVDRNTNIINIRYQCETEVHNMKSEMINDFISFYDIMAKNKLAIHVSYEDIVRALRSVEEYKIKFPIYADMLKINLMKAKTRKLLLNKIYPVDFGLPDDCLENILSYLHYNDLVNLVEAIEPTNDKSIFSNTMFEKMRCQDQIPETNQSMETSIMYFAQQKKHLSVKCFNSKRGPIYLTEVFSMFAYFERICLYKCCCRDRKCYMLHNTNVSIFIL